ncbi:hypothetical protein BJY14_006174 [Actinomadura luteofluorescens]|uniref:Uncharacterized protein n=1 Tax=Actinomadura luteofluorescens TaxID=46163 RepID=A0A7Y9EM83_9ACTN|nr:hypothetical protein [Actinomadura luteofluorescens]NYD50191.1 hypothetical protein [Actinomadura luteofluorescens]
MIVSVEPRQDGTPMPPRIVSGALALGLAAGVLAGGATAAEAESLQFHIKVPKHLSVGKGDYNKACAMDVWVWGTEGSSVAYSKAYLIDPNGRAPSPLVYKKVLPGYQVGWGVGCPNQIDGLGKWRVRVIAYDRKGKALGSREDYWYEKYDTVVQSHNAAPEPVLRGRPITVSGRLKRLNDLGTGYTAYPGKAIRVYFLPKGSTSWTYMGTTKTARDGRYRKAFTAARDGYWRAYFPGTSNFDRQKSPDDFVDVR